MILEIQYLKKSDKFLTKNSHIISKEKVKQLITKAVKKIILNEDTNTDLKRLKGNYSNFYKVRTGNIRILFEVDNQKIKIIAIVTDIDFRGNIYNK